MLKKLLPIIKYLSNFLFLFVLLSQWTLPTFEKKRNFQINFGKLIYNKCNDPDHSHPPLSKKKSSNDPAKYIYSEKSNHFFVSITHSFYNISDENKFEKFTTLSELSLAHSPPARGPPYFEV